KVVVGHDRVLERLLTCLLARGHCLVEGPPGLAKTLSVATLAEVTGGTFARLQFTPDLVPADIVGTRIWRASTETFDVALGPVFANFVLADEINRAPAKVQSALLEVMAERQVSIGGATYRLPEPFVIMATQNPIEAEGVYPLPEAQRDRFLMKVRVDYPSHREEMTIVERMGVRPARAARVVTPAQLVRLQAAADNVFVDSAIVDYSVRLVQATRDPVSAGAAQLAGKIAYGASPRASLALTASARALALLRGRSYVLPQDVTDCYLDVCRHRLVLSYEALADDVAPEALLAHVLERVRPPRVVPRQDGVVSAASRPAAPVRPQPILRPA
ncbi:MAG TPA: MoxR family ATPase, partial [Acidimicrobiales bacterium]|nr:MoxR family ATPase [Acidimicrobiales bacterium]